MQHFFMQTTETDQTVGAQINLNLRWAQMSESKFSHVAANIIHVTWQTLSSGVYELYMEGKKIALLVKSEYIL